MATVNNAVNNRLVQADASLVRSMSLIGFGTILKGWHGHRGLDYIITGIDTTKREIYAIKHNCINNDGSVHSAVRRHKRKFSYTLTPSGRFGMIKGVTSVLGQKASLDPVVIDRFNKSVNDRVTVTGFNTVQLYTQPLIDRRKSIVYQ